LAHFTLTMDELAAKLKTGWRNLLQSAEEKKWEAKGTARKLGSAAGGTSSKPGAGAGAGSSRAAPPAAATCGQAPTPPQPIAVPAGTDKPPQFVIMFTVSRQA
jgi:hypothetical protein